MYIYIYTHLRKKISRGQRPHFVYRNSRQVLGIKYVNVAAGRQKSGRLIRRLNRRRGHLVNWISDGGSSPLADN